MSAANAREEADRRLKIFLHRHPVLTGKTIQLISFPDDETCGLLVGGRVLFQRMCNKYLKQMLLDRGARVKIRPMVAIATSASAAAVDQALANAAEDAYRNELVDTDMVSRIIGDNNEYRTKADWIADKIEGWQHERETETTD